MDEKAVGIVNELRVNHRRSLNIHYNGCSNPGGKIRGREGGRERRKENEREGISIKELVLYYNVMYACI